MQNTSIFSKKYWQDAAGNFGSTHMLVFAALIVALRVAVKMLKIPLAAGLSFSWDAYVNAIGSLVYGPLMGLAVGAVSDTLGVLLFPSNSPYFFPFILTEMASSFIFALFFWKQKLTVPRVVLSKFTVNFVCNIVLTSVLMKWNYYVHYGLEDANAYAIINGTRIVKNLVMFPLEAILIVLIFRALIPPLQTARLLDRRDTPLTLTRRHYVLVAILLTLSVALVLFYIFFLKDFVKAHNFKFF